MQVLDGASKVGVWHMLEPAGLVLDTQINWLDGIATQTIICSAIFF